MLKIPKWKKLELEVFNRLRSQGYNVQYQYPVLFKCEDGKIYRHKIDYLINGIIAVELDGEIHYKSRRQVNKTEWRNRNIRKLGYHLIIIDTWEYDNDPDIIFKKLTREIEEHLIE